MLRPLVVLALLAAAGCHSSSEPHSPLVTDAVLRAGTSFGECLGYCTTETTFGPREVVHTRTSREPARHPPQTERLAISEREFEEILRLVDADVFFALEDVYGCPDCADGGAEWIEVESGGAPKRVTIEHLADLEAIAPLLARVRAYRARFEAAHLGNG